MAGFSRPALWDRKRGVGDRLYPIACMIAELAMVAFAGSAFADVPRAFANGVPEQGLRRTLFEAFDQ